MLARLAVVLEALGRQDLPGDLLPNPSHYQRWYEQAAQALSHYGATDAASKRLALILAYIAEDKASRPRRNKRAIRLDKAGVAWLAAKFMKGWKPPVRRPSRRPIVTDDALNALYQEWYGTGSDVLSRQLAAHRKLMTAENAVGSFLEAYIAKYAETRGWVWCVGSTARSIDFIRYTSGGWIALQVKNRTNTENSSSSKVRDGREVKAWVRMSAGNGELHWKAFPDCRLSRLLSEHGFRAFLRSKARG